MDEEDACPPTYLQQRLRALPSSRPPVRSWSPSELQDLIDHCDDGMVVLHRVFAQESETAAGDACLDAADALLRVREALRRAIRVRQKRGKDLVAVPAQETGPPDLHQDGA